MNVQLGTELALKILGWPLFFFLGWKLGKFWIRRRAIRKRIMRRMLEVL